MGAADEDTAKVRRSTEGLEYKRGFTNMAQALTMTETMSLPDGSKRAMSAVLTLTDGKPPSLVNTGVKVLQLKDNVVKLFLSPTTESSGE